VCPINITLTLVQSAFLNLPDVALGSLVPDVAEPGEHFLPEKPHAFHKDQILTHYVEDI
jgi:hypothetical protein